MKINERINKIEEAIFPQTKNGLPVAEVVIYNKGNEPQPSAVDKTGVRIFIPDNGRGDVQKTGQP